MIAAISSLLAFLLIRENPDRSAKQTACIQNQPSSLNRMKFPRSPVPHAPKVLFARAAAAKTASERFDWRGSTRTTERCRAVVELDVTVRVPRVQYGPVARDHERDAIRRAASATKRCLERQVFADSTMRHRSTVVGPLQFAICAGTKRVCVSIHRAGCCPHNTAR